jgi:hypothetical protein
VGCPNRLLRNSISALALGCAWYLLASAAGPSATALIETATVRLSSQAVQLDEKSDAVVMQFDLSVLPADAVVQKAELTVPGFKTWNVTTLVQEWRLSPPADFGLALQADVPRSEQHDLSVASTESQDSTQPYLEVTFSALDTTRPAVAVTAPANGATMLGLVRLEATASDNLAVAGVQFRIDGSPAGAEQLLPPYRLDWDTTTVGDGTHTITASARDLAGNSATSAAVTVSVDNGVVTVAPQDTFLNLDAINYSSNPILATYTWPDYKRANAIVMTFNLGGIPVGALVQDATLHLNLVGTDASLDPTYTVSVHKIVAVNPVIATATGYTADGAAPWTPNACCYNSVPLAQADSSAAYDTKAIDKVAGFKAWTITGMVQEWLLNPATNFGLILNADASKAADRYRFFASMENPDPNKRPFLRIAFSVSSDTAPPAVAVTAPTQGAIVNGVITVAASATDDAGVAGVQLRVDGAPIGPERTAAPYQVSWDTSAVADGSHTIAATARDMAGHSTTSAGITVTVDHTAPSVSISAPVNGATVGGTVTVSANASDSTAVAGVQFQLNGASLGSEDTAAPYSASWATTAVPDGSYTLTAVARDTAGNSRISAAVTVAVSNAPPPPPPPPGGIATSYPGDVGIENHPDVVFVERFEDAALGSVFARWTDVLNGGSMSFSTDVPAGSAGSRALDIPWTGGGTNTGGHLYKQLSPGVDDTLYVRYYIKYPAGGQYGHTGVWMGGSNPASPWPNPQAGIKPSGNDRILAAVEDNWQIGQFDHYDYWMNMRLSSDGNYWGNRLLDDPDVRARTGQWMCVEHMVKLNNPLSAFNGEHAIWQDGVKVSHLGPGFPNGSWSGGVFTQDPAGSPFEGFRWRSDANLTLNWIWLQNYSPNAPIGFSGHMLFDQVVVAKSRIGCLASGAGSDTTAPAVAISAPLPGATVSGPVGVSANASDNVGVAGVQFKRDGGDLGAEDTTAPFSTTWDTTTAPNGSHTLTAVARDAAGNLTISAAVSVTVSNGSPAGWPNDPAGFSLITDYAWNALTGNGWNYLRRSASKSSDTVLDPGAPFSASSLLRIVFTPDMQPDSEPGVHWIGVPGIKEIYTGWWMKLSPNWQCSPAGCGKVTFLFTNGAGQVYTGVFHSAGSNSAPYRMAVNTEWGPYGQRVWYPNAATTPINPDEWHRVEVYYRWETTPGVSNDGIIRFWVDGVLNGNYTNVHYPASSFVEFQFAPTLQNPPSAEQYMFIDHTRVTRR